jgi:rare lipoprotein A
VLVVVLLLSSACAHRGVETRPARPGETERGKASWYGEPYHGRRAASGEVYDMHQLTAAHRSLPFNTLVKVTRRDTGASVKVRITDRGPFVRGRIIDLSYAAAKEIDLVLAGVAPVTVEVIGTAAPQLPDRLPDPGRDPEPELGDCFWVQVGAFGDEANAERNRQRLLDAGFKALLMEGPDDLQRLRVGPFDQRDQAETALERLLPDWPPAKVVPCG